MQWQNGRRGLDGWARWTRRRKWYRDAELVEVDESTAQAHELDAIEKPIAAKPAIQTTSYNTADERMVAYMRSEPALPVVDHTVAEKGSSTANSAENASLRTADDGTSLHSTSASSKSIFWPPSLRRRTTDRSTATAATADKEHRRRPSDDDEDLTGLGFEVEMELQKQSKDGGEWGIGDEARMGLE
jgi:hypothetical protein